MTARNFPFPLASDGVGLVKLLGANTLCSTARVPSVTVVSYFRVLVFLLLD